MRKGISALWFAGLVAAVLSRTASAAGVCDEYQQFGRGMLHDKDVIFGVPTAEWGQTEADNIRANAQICANAWRKNMADQHQLTPEIADLLDRFPLMVDAELKRILDLNRPAREAAAKSAMNELQQCMASKSYLAYSAAVDVADDASAIAQGKKSMEKVMRLSVSGDMKGIQAQGDSVQSYVHAHESLDADWKRYRSLGGKASSPAKVKPGLNPCGKLQDIIDHGQG